MTRIDGIANFAFSGCKADEMVVCDSITSFIRLVQTLL